MKSAFWRRLALSVASLPFGLKVALLVAAILHGVGLSWGMPASDAWDNDGVAPRDFLPGLADTFTPGKFFTYPPLHLALLALVTVPVTVAAVLRAGSTLIGAVMPVILSAPYMTLMTMAARIVSLLMSLAIVLTLAKIGEELVAPERRRGVAAGVAAFASVNVSFSYYAHMSNLDVPYLFWALLAVLALVRGIARREPRRLRSVALFGALAITTKDQAYALFLFGVPASVALWFAFDEWARAHAKRVLFECGISAALAPVIVAFVDGAVTNPRGFAARVAFLTGSASQDYATYSRDGVGRWFVLVDVARAWEYHYPWFLAVFLVVGLIDTLTSVFAPPVRARQARGLAVAALVPLAIALSFTLCFNLIARRVEERFTLPQMLLASVYAGVGVDRICLRVRAGGGVIRWALRGLCAVGLALGAWRCLTIDANLLLDPRYEVEDFLAAHVQPVDTIETYGLNVYLPRFRPGMKVVRVGPSAPEHRSPLPEVVEVRALLGDIEERAPRWIVVSDCYAWRYLERNVEGDVGRVVPTVQRGDAQDADATKFFQSMWRGTLGYHMALDARIHSRIFPTAAIHGSVGCPVFVLERNVSAR